MIYLKLFENFNITVDKDYDRIRTDIKDIFIEYIDKGFTVSCTFFNKGIGMKFVDREDYCIKVVISNKASNFKTIDLKEDLIMLNEYIRDKSDTRVDVYYKFYYKYNTRDMIENETYLDTNNNYDVSDIHIFLVERQQRKKI